MISWYWDPGSKGAFAFVVPLGAATTVALATEYVRRRVKRDRQAREAKQLSEAEFVVRQCLPIVDRFTDLDRGAAGATERARRLANDVEKMSQILRRTGEELQEAFADFEVVDGDDPDDRACAELFVAWREVGEAKLACAARVDALAVDFSALVAKVEDGRVSAVEEAKRQLQAQARADIEAAQPLQHWLVALVHARKPPAELQRHADELRILTSACFEQLSQAAEAARLQVGKALSELLAEAREPAKLVGEKLVVLKPAGSMRKSLTTKRAGTRIELLKQRMGTPEGRQALRTVEDAHNAGEDVQSALRAADAAAMVPKPEVKATTDKIVKLKSMATSEGRQALREQEAAEEALKPPPPPPPDPLAMRVPPSEQLEQARWRVRGLYEHMVLKIGLRLLDEEWSTEGLQEFPRKATGASALFREGFISKLLAGSIRLQSITGNDISAAQPDLKLLSLRQLLRIRVLHLDFTPSGCGADSVTSVGGTHEAFLSSLDSLMFQSLGNKALKELASAMPEIDLQSEAHRLGREAVLLTAAGAAVPGESGGATRWWCWWLNNSRRVFFQVARFQASTSFPASEGGAFEVLDQSYRDKHEPTGRLRWLDWRVDLCSTEGSLSPTRPQTGGAGLQAPSPKQADSKGNALKFTFMGSPGGGGAGPNTESKEDDKSTSTGAGMAKLVSTDLLTSSLGNLRKTPSATASGNRATEKSPKEDRSVYADQAMKAMLTPLKKTPTPAPGDS